MASECLFLAIDVTQTGGIERSLSNLLPVLRARGKLRVRLGSFFGGFRPLAFNYPGVPIDFYGGGVSDFVGGGLYIKVKGYITLLIRIVKLDLNNYGRVVSVYPVITILLLLIHWRHHKKLYSWEHSQPDAHSLLLNWVRRRLYMKLAAVFVLTETQRGKMLGLSPTIKIIPNGIVPVNVVREQGDLPFHIVAVGRLSPEKGFDRFIESLRILAASREDWRATIFGDGGSCLELTRAISDARLEERVKIIRSASHHQIFSTASLIAVCSRSEVFGMVIVESMSAGVPVVAFDDGDGPKDLIVSNDNGLLVSGGDIRAFSRSIQRVMDDPALYRRLVEGGQRTASRYEIESIAGLWETELRCE